MPEESITGLQRGDRSAVVVVDMLHDYDHPDGEALRASAEQAVPVIAELIERARATHVPVIYVNDNGGDWTLDRKNLVKQMREAGDAALIDPLAPRDEEALVFKARHSIFYNSSLEYLLNSENIGRLILVGQVTEQCILYSALDAYMRHFEVVVPRDALAHIDAELAAASLRMMEENMHAYVVDAAGALEAGDD